VTLVLRRQNYEHINSAAVLEYSLLKLADRCKSAN